MKNLLRNLLLTVSLTSASVAFGAGMPTLDVTVSTESGNVVFKGKTNSSGVFATKNVEPGKYVVQFNSNSALSGNYALVVSAGKQKVMAEAVNGEKFGKGGVAMKVDAPKGVNITGQVSTGKAGNVAANAGNSKVKIINGKRYVWVGPETGSNMGGRWVEEGSPAAQNVSRVSTEGVKDIQERGSSALGR